MFSIRGKNEHATRSSGVQISLPVEFHSIRQAFVAFNQAGGVEEYASMLDGPVFLHIVGHPDGAIRIRDRNVKGFFIRRKGNSIWKCKFVSQQREISIRFEPID